MQKVLQKPLSWIVSYLDRKNLTHFLQFAVLLIKKELKVKYRGSFLGYLWSMLNPLLTMLVISAVFSKLVRGVEHYSLYVLSGLILWIMTTSAITLGTNSLVGASSLLKKIKVPYWIFPLVSLGSSSVNLIFALFAYLSIHLILGHEFQAQIFLLPLVFLSCFFFLFGIILALSCLNVFFRDISHVLEPLLQLVFYATPIIYIRESEHIPENIQNILLLNPMTHYVESFRACLFGGKEILSNDLLLLLSFTTISCITGLFVYKKTYKKIIYKL